VGALASAASAPQGGCTKPSEATLQRLSYQSKNYRNVHRLALLLRLHHGLLGVLPTLHHNVATPGQLVLGRGMPLGTQPKAD